MNRIYQRNLPHIQPPGSTIFITFRLAGSLPKSKIIEIKSDFERLAKIIKSNTLNKEQTVNEQFLLIQKFDKYLHASVSGHHFLKEPKIAKLICDTIHFHDGILYQLFAYCIMPNHVHLVLKPNPIDDENEILLEKIMHSLKSYTATEANKILQRKGQFWMHESFDHYIRSQESYERIIKYVMDNPVKANLVKKSSDWPWSFKWHNHP
jgi:REP element-mobilizing transposase RayT